AAARGYQIEAEVTEIAFGLNNERPKLNKLLTDAKILSTTVSERAGHWNVSVLVEQEQIVPVSTGPAAGVDLGIKRLATLSDGRVVENPRPLKRRLKRI